LYDDGERHFLLETIKVDRPLILALSLSHLMLSHNSTMLYG